MARILVFRTREDGSKPSRATLKILNLTMLVICLYNEVQNMKAKEKKQAIALRKQGRTYKEISSQIGVSKSTVSLWLRDVPLNENHLQLIANRCRMISILNGKKVAEKWLKDIANVKEAYKPPVGDPKFMLGIGLYWGEGTKHSRSDTEMVNSDPKLLKIFLDWINEFFIGEFEGFKVGIHHYTPDKDQEIKKYWSDVLGLPLACFNKSIIAVSRTSKKKRQTLINGTVHIRVCGKGVWKIRQKIEKTFEVLSYEERHNPQTYPKHKEEHNKKIGSRTTKQDKKK